jgi:hypothetical protein
LIGGGTRATRATPRSGGHSWGRAHLALVMLWGCVHERMMCVCVCVDVWRHWHVVSAVLHVVR